MKTDLKENEEKQEKRKVNYIKKFNKKYGVLKAILAIIIIVVIAILARRTIIMIDLMSKAEQTRKTDNYHIIYRQYEGNSIMIMDEYKKDNKILCIQKYLESGKIETNIETIRYDDGNEYIGIMEGENHKKIVFKGASEKNPSKTLTAMNLSTQSLIPDSKLGFIANIIGSSVKSKRCNGEECYYFTELKGTSRILGGADTGVYIDKDTGITIRRSGGQFSSNAGTHDVICDMEYEFGTTTDEDVEMPDISEYEIYENNIDE